MKTIGDVLLSWNTHNIELFPVEAEKQKYQIGADLSLDASHVADEFAQEVYHNTVRQKLVFAEKMEEPL